MSIPFLPAEHVEPAIMSSQPLRNTTNASNDIPIRREKRHLSRKNPGQPWGTGADVRIRTGKARAAFVQLKNI
ncbi:hypothetical protein DPMN_026233 [Dreissena polymorpha]|uniref:Uncharacterized protein n=1 Tax=Dreissena polymorpha TaxID=45954 RepID=A0A9D4LT06_DREPO|nr:hypothetical protein DPMN_026233 [Dreissena polymorpha]